MRERLIINFRNEFPPKIRNKITFENITKKLTSKKSKTNSKIFLTLTLVTKNVNLLASIVNNHLPFTTIYYFSLSCRIVRPENISNCATAHSQLHLPLSEKARFTTIYYFSLSCRIVRPENISNCATAPDSQLHLPLVKRLVLLIWRWFGNESL